MAMEQNKIDMEQVDLRIEQLKFAHQNYLINSRNESDKITKNDPFDTLYSFEYLNFNDFLKSILDDKHLFTGETGFIEKYLIPNL